MGVDIAYMTNESLQSLAYSRMVILFEQARKAVKKKPKRAKRYVQLARKLQERFRVKWPLSLKKHFCRKCDAYLELGISAKRRVHMPYQAITCLACGHVNKMRGSEKPWPKKAKRPLLQKKT